MSLSDQLKKLKENWLLVALVLVVIFFSALSPLSRVGSFDGGYDVSERGYGPSFASQKIVASPSYYPQEESFAPEVRERKVTTTVSLITEIQRGDFAEATQEVKKLVAENKGLILSQDENKYGEGRRTSRSARYTLKVPVEKAEDLIASLKRIGEVQSFSENQQDITGAYQDNEIELGVEKERLLRYEQMFKEATLIADKIELNDRIFNQERTIKYLEDALKNKDLQVQYTTIYLTVQEKASAYIDVVFVKFSELVSNFVESVNGLLYLLFWIVPWAVVAAVAWVVVKKVKGRK